MDDTKKWYQSTAVWGGILAIVGAIVGIWGYAVTEADTQEMAAALSALGGSIGGILAVVGRVKASKTITPAPKAEE